jgi:hypothetical protein
VRATTPEPAPAPAPEPTALLGYRLPVMSPSIERVLVFAFVIFIVVQTLEAPLRYAFSLLGASVLIYIRDVAILLSMAALAIHQFRRHQLQTAFVVFALLILCHGTVSFLLCHTVVAVLVSMKTLLNPMFGVVFLPILMKGKRGIGWLLLLLWLLTAAGIAADVAGYDLPWKGMTADVGDYKVTVNKRWNFQGEDRVGGFARDSVGAAMLMSMFGTYALLFARSFILRFVAATAGLVFIYLTTSKGCVIAYGLVILACVLPGRRSQVLNKGILATVFTAMVLLPIILPNYLMPSSPAFLRSFFDRVVRVWPDTWHNIGDHSWVFGAAMGNVGVGQQYLRFEDVNTADNLFLLAYGYFGIFSVVYLAWPFLAAMFRRAPVDALGRYAIVTLIYIFSYGIVVNIIEGPVAAFMLGTALQALALRKEAPRREPARGLTVPRLTSVVRRRLART